MLLFSYSIIYANENQASENATDSSASTLESDVINLEGLWTLETDTVDSSEPEQVDEVSQAPQLAPEPEPVPSTALALPPPLDPPPLKELLVMLDWYLSPQHAALLIAQERELFLEQGLSVELQSPADPTIPLKLLVAEEVDLALTREPMLHLQVHAGEPLIRIGTLVETPLNAVIVTGSPPRSDDIASLAGLRYGFSTYEGANVVAERLIPLSLRQTDDFAAPVNVHFDAAAAVVRGEVDVIADGYYHSLPDELAPEGIESHVIRYDEIDIPGHDGVIIVANSQSLAQNGQTWSRFMMAVEKASHWMIENPQAAWTLLVERHPILDNAVNQTGWEELLRRISLSPAAVNTRRYQDFEAYLLKRGITEQVLPISRLATDPHLLQE
ncbi:ABC transporter substrate-binding protein [Vreelandella sp. EE22]